MLISYKLLKEYVDIKDMTLDEVLAKLTLAGFELESKQPLSSGTNLIIGEVLECYDHPNSDHLHVTKTNIGKETLQIVCGAPNCRKGLKVIVALPGAVLPAKGVTIQKGEIRGQESNGMLCSLLELGVPENVCSEVSLTGIEELPADAPVGDTNPLGYLGLDDTIIDISVTPNRADVFGLFHFFKEVAAILDTKVIKEYKCDLVREGESRFEASSDTPNCNYFSMTTVEGVTIKPSPKWMQEILSKHDIKCINNIVDIGNYVTLMTGQPMHMYDAGTVKTNKFIVKDNLETTCTALDFKEYKISNGDLVVTNGDEIGCIAGVIGSASTMINDNTRTIALECALFDGTTIMNSCKRYGILTVAATNYSKNAVDKYNVLAASDMACDLLVKYADAKKISKAYEYDKRGLAPKIINIDVAFINSRLGSSYDAETVKKVFDRLSFEYTQAMDNFTVTVPTYRNDIEIREDLVEEVVRLVGFDTIPFTLATVSADQYGLSDVQKARRIINNYLLDNGLTNTLSYTLIRKDQSEYYGVFDNDNPIILPHPLTVEKEYLRKNMICSMLSTIFYNQARGIKEVAIYELSQVYSKEKIGGHEKLAIAISNGLQANKWLANKEVNFYMIKGLVEGLMSIFGLDSNRFMFEPLSKKYPNQQIFHPGKSAILKINGKEIGMLGEIHPNTLKREGIDNTVYFEMDLSEFFNVKTSKIKYQPVSKFPSVSRDIALVIKEDVEITSLIKSMKKAGGSILTNVDVFDVYQGEHIQKGYKSVALSMTFTDPTKTLVDATVNELFNKIYAQCQKDFNATIR